MSNFVTTMLKKRTKFKVPSYQFSNIVDENSSTIVLGELIPFYSYVMQAFESDFVVIIRRLTKLKYKNIQNMFNLITRECAKFMGSGLKHGGEVEVVAVKSAQDFELVWGSQESNMLITCCVGGGIIL
jgi:hypothetical protein